MSEKSKKRINGEYYYIIILVIISVMVIILFANNSAQTLIQYVMDKLIDFTYYWQHFVDFTDSSIDKVDAKISQIQRSSNKEKLRAYFGSEISNNNLEIQFYEFKNSGQNRRISIDPVDPDNPMFFRESPSSITLTASESSRYKIEIVDIDLPLTFFDDVDNIFFFTNRSLDPIVIGQFLINYSQTGLDRPGEQVVRNAKLNPGSTFSYSIASGPKFSDS